MAKKKDEAEKRKALFRAVFGTPEGEKVLSILSASVRINTHCFVAGDPHETSFKCGQHSVIHYIRSMTDDTAAMPHQEETIDE
jgi:hypothetical protein